MAGADSLHCLVEVPKGSRNKYEWDERLQAIKLERFLFSSVVYPTDYGFVQGTLSEKGTALDVTDPEPLPDGHPLWELGNVLITPHVGTPPETEKIAFAARVRENVRRFAAGEELEGLIDADGGY
jgi:hypothetical protein